MEKENLQQDLPDCCQQKKEYEGNSFVMALLYGLVPHMGCILFIVAAILGSTILLQTFRPLLMNRNIFYYLILISIGFATLSSFFYLRKNKRLSLKGIKSSKKYLAIMYGTTVGINILLFFFIFPMVANITGKVAGGNLEGLTSLNIKVDIPCPGHAPLIMNELKTIEGVEGTQYSYPNNFEIYYDSSKTNELKIFSLDVFEEYSAQKVNTKPLSDQKSISQSAVSSGTCSGGCGGTGTCGGSCGSPSCNYNQ